MSAGTPRMMIVMVAATGVMVAAIAGLALDSWAILVVLLLVHGVLTAAVVGYSMRRAADHHEKPDPVEEARIEEER